MQTRDNQTTGDGNENRSQSDGRSGMKTRIDVYCHNPRNNESRIYDTKRDGIEALREMRGWSSTCVLSTNVQTILPDGSCPTETEIARTGNGSMRVSYWR